MGLFSLFLASCPLIEGRQREWNGREALASLEWNFSAAEGPPAHNPQINSFQLSPSNWLNVLVELFVFVRLPFAEHYGGEPPITHHKERRPTQPPTLSAAANATQFNAGFLGLSRVEWNCFVCFFGLPRAFGRLAWAPFRSFSAAGNANKNQRNSIFISFGLLFGLLRFIHSISLFCLHSINWFQQLARLPCGLVACGLQPPLTHPQSTHFSCFHQLIPFSSARTATNQLHSFINSFICWFDWTVLLGGPPPQTIHQFNHSSH